MPKATEWYKDIEGRTVDYENSYGEFYHCIVTGFDYYLGITLQAKNNAHCPDGTYIYCYRGPMTPLNGHHESWRAKQNKEHRKYMAAMARAIRKNKLIISSVKNPINVPTANSCPFNQ